MAAAKKLVDPVAKVTAANEKSAAAASKNPLADTEYASVLARSTVPTSFSW